MQSAIHHRECENRVVDAVASAAPERRPGCSIPARHSVGRLATGLDLRAAHVDIGTRNCNRKDTAAHPIPGVRAPAHCNRRRRRTACRDPVQPDQAGTRRLTFVLHHPKPARIEATGERARDPKCPIGRQKVRKTMTRRRGTILGSSDDRKERTCQRQDCDCRAFHLPPLECAKTVRMSLSLS